MRAFLTVVGVLLVTMCAASGTLAQNLVANGDFEGGWGAPGVTCDEIAGQNCCLANSWTAWTLPLDPTGGSPNPGNPTWVEMPTNDCAADAGNNYQRIFAGEKRPPDAPSYGSNARGGLVQAISTVAATTYDFDAQFKFSSLRGEKLADSQAYLIYGYDLTGQTADPLAASIVWIPEYPLPDENRLPPLPHVGQWNQHSTRFTATGASTSLWIMVLVPDDGRAILDIDNVSVTPATESLMSITAGPTSSIVSDTSFTIQWTTDVPSSSIVEYSPHATDTDAGLVYDLVASDPALTTNHSITLSGLDTETIYHYRVGSAAAGYRTAYSYDAKFIVPGPAAPFFKNGGFEDVDEAGTHTLRPWINFGIIGGGSFPDGLVGPYPNPGPGWFQNFKANEGSYFLGMAGSYDVKNGGVYQRLQAVPGGAYSATFDYKTTNYDLDPPQTPPIGRASYDDVQVWVGIDPKGGVDPDSPDVVWSQNWSTGYQYVGLLTPAQWSPPALPLGSVQTVAQNNRITLFVKLFNKWSWVWNVAAADNIQFAGPTPPPTPVDGIGEAKALGEYAYVNITTPSVVTLAPMLEQGFFYAQDEDGSGGIRVKSDVLMNVGDLVSLTGVVSTNLNGERFLDDATVVPAGSGGNIVVRNVNSQDVGGAGFVLPGDEDQGAGLSNEGLLMKIVGKVTRYELNDQGEPVMWLDDGGNVNAATDDGSTGIKVIKTNLYLDTGQVGNDIYSVVGVVTSEIVDGKKIRVLRAREGFFPEDTVKLYP